MALQNNPLPQNLNMRTNNFVISYLRTFILLVCCVVIGVTAWTAWTARANRLSRIRTDAVNLSSILAKQAQTTLEKTVVIMGGIIQRAQMDEITTPEGQKKIYSLARMRVTSSSEILAISIFGKDGSISKASYPQQNPLDTLYFEDFKYHQEHPDSIVRIGQPFESSSLGHWVLPVSQRLEDTQGRFDGVVLVSLSLDVFEKYYASLHINPNDALALTINRQILYARVPGMDPIVGAHENGTELLEQIFDKLASTHKHGGTIRMSLLDGKERIVMCEEVQSFPIMVLVGLSTDDALSDWKRITELRLSSRLFLSCSFF